MADDSSTKKIYFSVFLSNIALYYCLYDGKYFGPKAKGCFRDHDTHVFTVFRNHFSITIKVILPLSDRYQIFTTDWWLWIEVYQNLVLSKIDINMAKINKKLEIYKAEFYAI